jgi:hypothetical protein
MSQSKLSSIYEAILNVGSGMIIAFCVTQTLAPGLGIDLPYRANMILTSILTVVSVLRGYMWRRYFNSRVQLRAGWKEAAIRGIEDEKD